MQICPGRAETSGPWLQGRGCKALGASENPSWLLGCSALVVSRLRDLSERRHIDTIGCIV